MLDTYLPQRVSGGMKYLKEMLSYLVISLQATVPRKAEHGLRSAAFAPWMAQFAEKRYCGLQTDPRRIHSSRFKAPLTRSILMPRDPLTNTQTSLPISLISDFASEAASAHSLQT